MIVGTIRGVVTVSVLSHSFAMVHTTGVQRACRDSDPIAAMDPPLPAPCGIPSCARLGRLLLLADRMHDVDREDHHEVICR